MRVVKIVLMLKLELSMIKNILKPDILNVGRLFVFKKDMKTEDFRRRANEDFKEILPLINKLIQQVKLANKAQKFNINGAEFLMRLNTDIIEISLASERPIFPTLAFRPINDKKADLLYYRIGNEFRSKLHQAIE